MKKIREFAVLCGTTPKTLRFYDKIGLLEASYIDPENGCAVAMTAFCDTARVPGTYCEVTVTNTNNYRVSGTLGLLPRYNKEDHYLTGLHDTGYEPYNPNVGQWYLSWQNRFAPAEADSMTAVCEDGYGRLHHI